MSITNPDKVVTKQDLADFYEQIFPYLGGMPEMLANKFSKGDLYSTSEKMIGQWTDGKPLYQRVVSCNAVITGTSWSDTGINFAEFNLDILVRFTALRSNGSSASDNMIDNSLIVRADNQCNNKILAMTGRNSGSVTIEKAIIQYTKTTDTAISIGSETEYSTDEKVVGTWIDGKPIYQKTWQCSTASASSMTQGITYTETPMDVQVETTISVKGMMITTGQHMDLPNTDNTFDAKIKLAIYPNSRTQAGAQNKIFINLSTNATNYASQTVYVTVQYTKVTD